MSGSYVIFQFGTDPFNNRYEDSEGRLAFSLYLASQSPNMVIRLARHIPWAEQYPNVMGPENAYFYFGPEMSPGYIVYGNNQISIRMSHMSRQQREGSTSRYFTAQSGRHYKWRITPQRMEVRFVLGLSNSHLSHLERSLCMDGRTCIALWEAVPSTDFDYDARVTLRPSALMLITEIMTTLILNRMYLTLNWQ
ncbi:hypothetical protein EV361DRAFT_796641 [Lentinula raphanica]|nr:hypothetical protein EV360DRAFT_36648 [Lentinula raphanica]KAJ3773895.1 hypothetical protein FB446DRAFT_640770 [Lentinula raphanica]KAJ3823266.1 hypothetical protein F5880DRAFT_1482569 [Lentinula raphanica]KAJ3973230.1 hypothetical protein EV361DRAFT_796641 [Lentinula raphanica]